MQKGLVTLIMPVYNGIENTKNAINSLVACTEPPYELIIVNNGSTDLTNDYLTASCHIVMDNPKNFGWATAVNQAIKVAQGEFICLLHNDVVFTTDWLEKMIAHFADPTIGVIGPLGSSGRQDANIKEVFDIERANHLDSFCMLFRREVLDEIGEFDEQFFPHGYEEIDYAIRIKSTKWKMAIARDVLVHHEGGATLHNMPEWKENPEGYRQKRHQLLINKHGEGKIDAIYKVPPKVYIVVPHRGIIEPKHYSSMMTMETPGLTEFVDISRAVVHTARNLGVEAALMTNAEYVFMIDSDAVVIPDLLMKLLSYKKDVVGVIAHTRHVPYFSCVFMRRKDEQYDDWQSIECSGHGLVEVDGIGFHATLVHSRVFEALKSPWFEFTKFGEDLTFCDKAKQAGFKVWCDSDITLDHIGEPLIINRKVYLLHKAHEEKEKEIRETKGDAPKYKEIVSPDPRRTVKIPII